MDVGRLLMKAYNFLKATTLEFCLDGIENRLDDYNRGNFDREFYKNQDEAVNNLTTVRNNVTRRINELSRLVYD